MAFTIHDGVARPASDARLTAMARQFVRANGDRDDRDISQEAHDLADSLRWMSRAERERFQLILNRLCRRMFGRD